MLTYYLRLLILISIGLDVPDDLMCEQLRELGRFDNISFDVTKYVVAKCLHDLRNVEEGHIHRMALERSHSILNDEGMISVSGHEVGDRAYRVQRFPVHKILKELSPRMQQKLGVHVL